MHSENFFTPSFLRAIKANTAASFRSIMAEPSRGIYTFEMLQPQFCEMLVSEVSHSFFSFSCIYQYICSILVYVFLSGFD
jgi:hypothetical protein